MINVRTSEISELRVEKFICEKLCLLFIHFAVRWIAIVDANLFGFVNLTQSFRLKFQFCLSKTQENTSKSKCQYDKAMRTQHQEFKIMLKNLYDGIIKIEISCFFKIFVILSNAFTANKILLVASILEAVFQSLCNFKQEATRKIRQNCDT